MNTKLQNVAERKHHLGLRSSPVWWLSLILAAFLLSCFPEQLAEYLASQDVHLARCGESVRKGRAGSRAAEAAPAKLADQPTKLETSSSAKDCSLSGFTDLATLMAEGSPTQTICLGPVESTPDPVESTSAKPEVPAGSGAKPDVTYEEVPSAFGMLAELPGPDRLFRLESEASLRERLRQEVGPGHRLREFPQDEPVRATTPPPSREQIHVALVEPGYVAYRPLIFEDRNTERYGWEFGDLQPILSAGSFYLKLFTLEARCAKAVVCPMDTGAGRCLPGDPVPYRVEVPRLLPEHALGGFFSSCPARRCWLH
jgi:hypothetical protein